MVNLLVVLHPRKKENKNTIRKINSYDINSEGLKKNRTSVLAGRIKAENTGSIYQPNKIHTANVCSFLGLTLEKSNRI